MRRRRIFTAAAAAIAVCACLAPLGAGKTYRATAAETLDNVSDDFESYTTGDFIENNALFKQNWVNNVLKGGEEQGMDAHLTGVAKVEYENGSSGNKVLHLNNAAVAQDSFFHIGPSGDYRTKNFTAGFRLKYLVESVGERSWVGISFRKKAEAHYTGTNNLLFTVQRYKEGTAINPNAYAIFNGGNTNDLGSPSTMALFEDVLSVEYTNYEIPSAQANEDTPWMEYKLDVRDNRYLLTIDDTVVVDCTFDVPSYDYFGFLSLNCCTANVLIDDFYIENRDTELPPEINPLPAPVLTWDEDTRTVGWELIDGANLYSVYLNDKLVKSTNRGSYQIEEELEAGEYAVRVKALSADTFDALDSELSDPVTFTVSGSKKGKSGCNGSVSGGLLLAPLALAAGLMIRRKR